MPHTNQNIFKKIKSAINQFDPNAEIILFGSRARGQETKESDWDVLILVNQPEINRQTEMKYREQLFTVELETGEAISTFVFAKPEWETRHSVTPFYENVQKDGIQL